MQHPQNAIFTKEIALNMTPVYTTRIVAEHDVKGGGRGRYLKQDV